MLCAAQVAERTITSDLEELISAAVDTSKADYAVVTGALWKLCSSCLGKLKILKGSMQDLLGSTPNKGNAYMCCKYFAPLQSPKLWLSTD